MSAFPVPAFPPPPPDEQVLEFSFDQLRRLIPNLPPFPPPPPTIHIDDIPEEPFKPTVEIPPEELAKWITARKRNFPCRGTRDRKAKEDKLRIERGEPVSELSKLEVKLRKRLQLMRNAFRKVEERKVGNPFLKYLHLHKRLLNNQVLHEHTVLLQCFRYLVKHQFFDSSS